MEDVYKVVMDATGSITQARLLSDAIDSVTSVFAKVTTKMVAFNDEGTPTKVVVEGITAAGKEQVVTLKHLETGWSEVARSFKKVKDEAKVADTAISQLSASAKNSIDNMVTKIRNGFNMSQQQVDKFSMASMDREIHQFIAKNSNNLKEFSTLITNLGQGRMTTNGSAAAMELQQMLLRRGNISTETRPQGPVHDRLAIQRAAAANVIPDNGGNFFQQMHADQEKMTKGTNKAKDAADGLLLSWRNFGRYMISHAAYQGVYAVTGALRSAVEQSMELSKAISTVRTIAKSGDQQAWTDSAIKVSNIFGTDAVEVAKSYYSALSNQMGESVADIEQYTIATQRFALATASTAEQANNLFASFINSYKLTTDSVSMLSGQLFKTIDLGRIVASDMANTIGRVIAPAAQLGVKTEEVLASLALLTQKGVKPADAMTQLLNLMNKLIKPSQELQRQFSALGYAGAEAFIQMEGFPALLKRIASIADEGGLAKLAKQFNDLRGFRGVLSLSEDTAKFDGMVKEIQNAGDQVETAITTKMLDPAISLEQQMNRIKNIFIQFGSEALPVVDDLAKSLGGLDNIFRTLAPPVAALASAAGIAGVTLAFRSLFTLLATANPWILAATGLFTAASVFASTRDGESDVDKKLAGATPKAGKDDYQYHLRLAAAQAHSRAESKLINDQYVSANQVADKYYQALQKAEDDYRITLVRTSKEVTNQFESRIKEVTEAAKKAADELKASVSNLERIKTAQGKDSLDAGLIGKDADQQYQYLQAQGLLKLEQMRTADAETRKRLTGEIIEIARKQRDIEEAAVKRPKQAKELELTGRKAELEAEKDLLARQKTNIEISNKEGRAANKSFKKMSVTDIDRRSNQIQGEIDSIDAQLAKKALEDRKAYNLELEKETKAYDNVNKALKTKIDLLTEAAEIERDNAAKLAIDAAKKADEEKKVREAAEAYKLDLQELNRLMAASTQNKFYEDKEASAKALEDATVVSNRIIQHSMDAGVDMKPADVAAIQGVPTTIQAGRAAKESQEAKIALENQRRKNAEERKIDLDAAKAKEADRIAKANRARGNVDALGFDPNKIDSEINKLKALRDAQFKSVRESDKYSNSFYVPGGNVAVSKTTETTEDQIVATYTALKVLESYKEALASEAKAREARITAESKSVADLSPDLQLLISSNNSLITALDRAAAAFAGKEIKPLEGEGKAMGGLGSDTYPTMLAPGEFVVNSNAASRWRTQLMSMNNGTHMASGGTVSNTNVGDIHISMSSQGSPQADVIQIGKALRREIRRGTVRL